MLEITYLKRLMLTLLALLCTSVCGYGKDTQAKIEDAAKRLPCLILDLRLSCDSERYDNEYELPPKERELHRRILLELLTADYPTKELLPLLKHADPKVRTLAILALFNKEDGKVLPDIYLLVKDKAPSFGTVLRDQSAKTLLDLKAEPVKPVKMPKLHPQTVGDVADMAIQNYLRLAGGIATSNFEEYWAARKDREYCASWFLVRLERVNPPLEFTRNRIPRLKALRADIDRLPADDRALTLLWLQGWYSEGLVKEKELVTICKELGEKKLLKMISGEKISDDPDLQLSQHDYRMRSFVFAHPTEVLTKAAVPTLVKLAERTAKEGGNSFYWWWMAAKLEPTRGEWKQKAIAELKHGIEKIKKSEGWSKQSERTSLATVLWEIAGTAESKFLLDWFYSERQRTHFLGAVADHRPQENRRFLAELVRDPRFDQLDWCTLMELVMVLNRWTKQPIVTETNLRNLSHPAGISHFRGKVDGDRHPEETTHVLKTLAHWRQKVRDSVPEWNPR